MGEAQHTPTPWSVQECDEIWCDTDGRPNAPLFKPDAQYRRWGREVNREQREANAAFIVHAVNSHATLTAALEEARGALEVFAEAHKAYDAYSLCVRVDEFGAPTMRRLQSPTDNDASVVLGSYPISESTSTTVHIRVADFRRARTALATINEALGRKEP